MRRPERAVYLVLGAALVPVAEAVRARAALPAWVDVVPLVLSMGLVAVVGNVSAIGRLAAVARAVRVTGARSPEGVALAGDAHGAPHRAFR
jgi:hypothetical protein